MNGPWSEAKNVLCVRLDSLGDVVMTTPAMRALKYSVPDRRLTLLSSNVGALALRHLTDIDDVICYEAPWVKKAMASDQLTDLNAMQDISRRGFDAAVIFTPYSESALPAALMCRLAGIPLRLAYSRENPRKLLTDWVSETEPDKGTRHEVKRQLDLVETVGARTEEEQLSFQLFDEDVISLKAKLTAAGVDVTRPWIAIHPGASAASRRYPAERFATVARNLVRDYDCQIVFTGDSSERLLTELLRRSAGSNTYSVAGELSLGEFGALLAGATVLVSNNTGAVHIAAAVGTPVVDLYALTNPQHTPWGVSHRVLFHDVPCKYCYKSVCPKGHHDCLNRVEPDEVIAAVRALVPNGLPKRIQLAEHNIRIERPARSGRPIRLERPLPTESNKRQIEETASGA